MNKTNKILVWVIALLIILNLTTVGTIIYHHYNEKKNSENTVLTAHGNNPLSGQFFRKELNFDDNQMDKFRVANQAFQQKANALIVELDSMKQLMFSELNKSKVDSVKLNALSKEIGEHHAALKQETNKFYLELKNISNTEQKEKLQSTFQSLFYQDGANDRLRNGNGGMYRHRHGQGRGGSRNRNQ